MSYIDQLLNMLPAETASWLRRRLDTLPASVKAKVDAALSSVAGSAGYSLRVLVDAYRTARGGFAGEPLRVSVVGPAGAGKTALVEALVGRTADASPRHRLAESNGPFRIVHVPNGRGLFANRRREQTLNLALDADVVLLAFDVSSPMDQSVVSFCRDVRSRTNRTLAVLCKADLLAEDAQTRAALTAQDVLNTKALPVSIHRLETLVSLVEALLAIEPRTVQVVPHLLPSVQRAVAWSRVRKASAVAAAIAAEPIPLADVIPLTILQAAMVCDLGRIYGRSSGIRQAGDVAGTVLAGVLLRTTFTQIARAVPGVGGLFATAYAAAGTAAVGYVAIRVFESRSTISTWQIRRNYHRVFLDMLRYARQGSLPQLPPAPQF